MGDLPVYLCSECTYCEYKRNYTIKLGGSYRKVDELWCGRYGIPVGARSAGCDGWDPRTLESMEIDFPKNIVDYAIEMAEARRKRRMADRPKS